MLSVKITSGTELQVSKPSFLFEGDYELGFFRQTANYDVAPNGNGFVMLRGIEGAQGSQISVVLNWHQELKRLAPTDN